MKYSHPSASIPNIRQIYKPSSQHTVQYSVFLPTNIALLHNAWYACSNARSRQISHFSSIPPRRSAFLSTKLQPPSLLSCLSRHLYCMYIFVFSREESFMSQFQPPWPPQGQQPPMQQHTGYPPQGQPWPPAPQQSLFVPSPKKSPHTGWWIGAFLILGLVILGFVIHLSSSAPQVVKVGQTITLNGVQATLIGVGTLYYDAPPDGAPIDIAVHIKLVNTSGSEQSYSPFNFHVKRGTGTINGPEITVPDMYQSTDLLTSGRLIEGGSVEGDILFQVTQGDHQAEVTWQPTASDSDSANGWMLGL